MLSLTDIKTISNQDRENGFRSQSGILMREYVKTVGTYAGKT